MRQSGHPDHSSAGSALVAQAPRGKRERRKRLTKRARREQLLDTAGGIIERLGVSAVTMERLAATAGVSKALVYLHFENASEAVAAFVVREQERIDVEVFNRAASATSLRARVEAITGPYFDALAERPEILRILTIAPPDLLELEDWRATREPAVLQFLTQQIWTEFPTLERETVQIAAAFLQGGFYQVLEYRWRHRTDREFIEEIYRDLVEGALRRLSDGGISGE